MGYHKSFDENGTVENIYRGEINMYRLKLSRQLIFTENEWKAALENTRKLLSAIW